MARVKEATIRPFCRIIMLPNGAQVLVRILKGDPQLNVSTQIRGKEGSISLWYDNDQAVREALDKYSDTQALGFWRSVNRMVK